MVYRARFRTARATQRNPVTKKQNPNENKQTNKANNKNSTWYVFKVLFCPCIHNCLCLQYPCLRYSSPNERQWFYCVAKDKIEPCYQNTAMSTASLLYFFSWSYLLSGLSLTISFKSTGGWWACRVPIILLGSEK